MPLRAQSIHTARGRGFLICSGLQTGTTSNDVLIHYEPRFGSGQMKSTNITQFAPTYVLKAL